MKRRFTSIGERVFCEGHKCELRSFDDGHYPRNLTQLTQEQYEDVVRIYSRLPMDDIRNRQNWNHAIIESAYEHRNWVAWRNQKVVEQQLIDAIFLKEYGEMPGNRMKFLKDLE